MLPDFQFQTQQLDSGSNLYFLRARYYDPELGRFISRDPVKGTLTNPQTQNPYAYAINNPNIYSDPSGLWYWDVGVSGGLYGLGVGFGAQVNDQVTLYVSGGASTPGIDISALYSSAEPQENSTSVEFAAGYGVAASVSYPYTNETVPVSSGEVQKGFGTPNLSASVKHTFGTRCW